jgi:AraC-like DNA-binding protein
MGIKLTLPEIERIVWELLEEHPGNRPTMREIAAVRGCTVLQLRRQHDQVRRVLGARGYCPSFRDALTYSCVTYAQLLIRRGTKIQAAMRLAGFQQKTNFNRQFRRFLGALPSEARKRSA